MIEIVPYGPRFAEQGLALAREIHADSAYSDMAFLPDKVLAQFAGPFSQEPYFLRVAARGDLLYGVFLGLTIRALFCDELIAKDVGWWVRKSMRGSGAAILLLRSFEEWARARGARKIMIGQASAVDIEKTTRLYQHCGYRVVGYNTAKELH